IFDPPWTTLHVGVISGGTAHNITAKDCIFGLDFRFVPGDDPEKWSARFLDEVARVQADMQSVHADTRIDVAPYFGVPALKPEEDGAAETLSRKLTGDNGTHVVSYGTEAGHFQNGGYSAVVCGPGDIAQAHQQDEFITLEQVAAGEAFMDRLIHYLCR
ncbi:MAG: M20/M25/M40 family metallo-hydrolase, partial [Boseongicola sp.]